MVKQYTLTIDDFRILQRRTPNPCDSCERGPHDGDYGYCGCSYEEECEKKKKYDAFIKKAKAANLMELYRLLARVDVLLAQKKEIEKKLNEMGAKIGGEFGTKVLMEISNNLYKGEF